MSVKNNNDLWLDPAFGSRLDRDVDDARQERLKKEFGDDTGPWSPQFGGFDNSRQKAREAIDQMANHLAASGANPDRPMVFGVTIAGRKVRIEVREKNGQFECDVPCEIASGHYEYRTLIARGYDALIGNLNRVLAAGPHVKDLRPEEKLELALLALTDAKLAFWRYLKLRVGDGADLSTLTDPRYLAVCNQAILFIFAHTEPSFPNTPQAIAFIESFAANRPLTIPICKAAMKSYKEREAQEQAEKAPHVGEAELEAASDKEIRESLRGIARERVEQDRKRRELIYGKQ